MTRPRWFCAVCKATDDAPDQAAAMRGFRVHYATHHAADPAAFVQAQTERESA